MSGTGGVSPPPETPQPQPQPSDDKFVEELWAPGSKSRKTWIVAKLTGGTVREELAEVLQKLVIYLPYSRYNPKIASDPKSLITLSFKRSGVYDGDLAVTTLQKSSFVSELCYKGIFLAEAQSEHSMEDAEYRACIVLLKHLAETVPILKCKDEYWSLDAWKNTLVHTPEESSLCRIQSFQQIPNFSTAISLISSIPEDSDQEIIFTDMIDNKQDTPQEVRKGFKNLSSIFDWRVIEKTEIERKSKHDSPGHQYHVVGVSRIRLSSYWTEKLNASDSADDPSCLIAHCRYQLYPPNDPDGMKYLKEICIFAIKELHKTVRNDSHSLIKDEPCNLIPHINKNQEEILPSWVIKNRSEGLYDVVRDLVLKGEAIHEMAILELESAKTRRWMGKRFLEELQKGLLLLPYEQERKIIFAFTECGIPEIVTEAMVMLRELDYSQAMYADAMCRDPMGRPPYPGPGWPAHSPPMPFNDNTPPYGFNQEASGSGIGMLMPTRNNPYGTKGDGLVCPPVYNYVREQLRNGYSFKRIREWTEEPLPNRRWMVEQYYFELKEGFLSFADKEHVIELLHGCGCADIQQRIIRLFERRLKGNPYRNEANDFGPCSPAYAPYPGESPRPSMPPTVPQAEKERKNQNYKMKQESQSGPGILYPRVKERLLNGFSLKSMDLFNSAGWGVKNKIVKRFIDEHAQGLLPPMTRQQLRNIFKEYTHLHVVKQARKLGILRLDYS